MNYSILTDTEKSHIRTHKFNEDHCLFTEFSFMGDKKIVLMVVADGMGGLEDGQIASENAVIGFTQACYQELMSCYLKNRHMDGFSLEYAVHDVEDAMIRAMQAANDRVCEKADPMRQTGTTLSAVCVVEGQFAVVINIGDSPVYFYRKAKDKLQLVSKLQTQAEQDVEVGLYERYSPEYYENDHRIYASLGAYSELEPDEMYVCSIGKLKCGDLFLLGSDGAFGRLLEEEIQKFTDYCARGDEGFVLSKLFSRARKDKDDDQTAILFICEDEEETK